MNLLIWPTDMEDKPCLDKVAFLRFAPEWQDVFIGTAPFTEELQDEFEVACERFWQETGAEEGFFLGGNARQTALQKIRDATLNKIAGVQDLKERAACQRELEAANEAIALQEKKIRMCEQQLEQSQSKLIPMQRRQAGAQKRWLRFEGMSGNSVDDF